MAGRIFRVLPLPFQMIFKVSPNPNHSVIPAASLPLHMKQTLVFTRTEFCQRNCGVLSIIQYLQIISSLHVGFEQLEFPLA